MDKVKARRIYAITHKVDDVLNDVEGTRLEIMTLMENIRGILSGELTEEDCEKVADNYKDYFDKDGNIRTCSLIR